MPSIFVGQSIPFQLNDTKSSAQTTLQQLPRAAPRADRQLVYIESYSSPFLPSPSLLSLVSSISAIYEAPFYLNSISYVPS
jgi:hypothetical protein